MVCCAYPSPLFMCFLPFAPAEPRLPAGLCFPGAAHLRRVPALGADLPVS